MKRTDDGCSGDNAREKDRSVDKSSEAFGITHKHTASILFRCPRLQQIYA